MGSGAVVFFARYCLRCIGSSPSIAVETGQLSMPEWCWDGRSLNVIQPGKRILTSRSLETQGVSETATPQFEGNTPVIMDERHPNDA